MGLTSFPHVPVPEPCLVPCSNSRPLVKGCALHFMHMWRAVSFWGVQLNPELPKLSHTVESPRGMSLFTGLQELAVVSQSLSPACGVVSRNLPAEQNAQVQRSRAASCINSNTHAPLRGGEGGNSNTGILSNQEFEDTSHKQLICQIKTQQDDDKSAQCLLISE